jgi:hypothetical protein
MGCSSGVLSFQAHDPNFGKASPTRMESGSLSIAQWVPFGAPQTEISSEEKTYLYRIPLDHLTRRGATLHEIQTGPYAGRLLYFSGKDADGDWIANAVILDPVTHEVEREILFLAEFAMYEARAVEITQGENASRIILMSDNRAQGIPEKALIIDLSREEPTVDGDLLLLPDVPSLASLTEVTPSAFHDMGHALLISQLRSDQTEILRLDLSDLLDGSEVWENTGAVSVERVSPRFFDLSKTNPSEEVGPLIMTPSGQAGDTHPEVLFVRFGGIWQVLAPGSSGMGCAGAGSHFLAPEFGSSAGYLVRVSGRPTGITVNGSEPTEDQCRRSMEVIRFNPPGGGGGWTSERLVFQSGISDPSNETDGVAKIVEIRSGPWAGDLVISPSLVGNVWDIEHSEAEQLRRVRLSFDGAVWSVAETIAHLHQMSAPTTVNEVQRRQPQLVALSDGRTALAGGECKYGTVVGACLAKIAMHSAYAPIKIEVTGSQAAALEILDGLQNYFSMGYAQTGRWILFPHANIAGNATSFKAQANHLGEVSNILEFTIESGPE